MQIIHKLTDMRYLEWTKTRHSSGTAGSFLKAYEKVGSRKYYYKLSNYDSMNGIVGHECVNEIIADRLLTKLGIPHLTYTLIHALVRIRGREYETYLCRSEDLKRKGDKKIALDAFYDMEAKDSETPMDFCLRYHFEKTIYDMLLIDYLIMNRDRHGANIEVLKNSADKTIRLAPLFDHGLSLLFAEHTEEMWEKADPLGEKRVQCFVGGASSYDNLRLIPAEERKALPVFDETMKRELFDGLQEVMGDRWTQAIWHFLKERADQYEDLCDSRS